MTGRELRRTSVTEESSRVTGARKAEVERDGVLGGGVRSERAGDNGRGEGVLATGCIGSCTATSTGGGAIVWFDGVG